MPENDAELERQQSLADYARNHLDPEDVLAYTVEELVKIVVDQDNPLWSLVRQCVSDGTYTETDKIPYRCEGVGVAFLPLIDRAIARLMAETLDSGVSLEDPT